MAILSSVEQFLNNCKETITGWFSTWANTNIKGKYLPLTGGTLAGADSSSKANIITDGKIVAGDYLQTNGKIRLISTGVSKKTQTLPSSNSSIYHFDKEGTNAINRLHCIGMATSEDSTYIQMTTHSLDYNSDESVNTKGTYYDELKISWKKDKGFYTYAPTPNTNVNLANQIATAGWVNDKIADIPTTGTYTLPTASSSTKGGVKVGNGLQVTNEAISIKLPTSSNLSVDANGIKCTYKYTHHTQSTIAFGPTKDAAIANGGTFQIPQISVDGEGHTTSITARTMTLPKYTAGTGITISGNTISSSVASLSIGSATGTGNAITSLSISNNKIVPNLGSKFSLDGHTHSGYAASNHNHDSVYSKTTHNHDSAYAAKSHTHSYAPLASPELTGTPKAPTATAGTNTKQIATTAFVSTAVSNALSSVSVNLNLSAATVTRKTTGVYQVSSSSVGSMVVLMGENEDGYRDMGFLFPKNTTWFIFGSGYEYTPGGENHDDEYGYFRTCQTVSVGTSAAALRTLIANGTKMDSFSGYAIRMA